jgi:hypothetical protein
MKHELSFRHRSSGVALGIALTLATGAVAACGGGVETRADHTLVVETADPSRGLRAGLVLDGEQLLLEVRSHDGVRDTTVIGADGTSYAVWHTQLADLNTSGSYGARRFGRFDDRDSDGDTDAWALVLESRVGDVLRAVSDGAAEALADQTLAPVAGELTTVSQLYGSLVDLARGDADEEEYNDCYFGYGYLSLTGWTTQYRSLGYCTFNKDAYTCAPATSCTRTYHVAVYRDSDGALLGSDSNSSGGCAHVFHQGTGNGSFAWTSKHWDSLNPGGPHWKHLSMTCSVIINV